MSLGAQIKELRIRREMTQEQLAVRARLSRIYIAKLEGGERTSPSVPALRRIAQALRAKLVIDLVD